MPDIRFGEYLPDQPPLGNPGCVRAENVYPTASGFAPARQLMPATNALGGRPLGAIQVVDALGNVRQYAGDAGKIYENLGNVWTDRSKTGGYTTGVEEVWEFVSWKNKLLAVNFTDDPQQITYGGLAFDNLTTVLKARHIAVVRDHVVMANTFDTTDGAAPWRVRWSGFNNESAWDVDPSTLSDFRDISTSEVHRVFGGEFGVILTASGVWHMSFSGFPTVFQFDEVLPKIGVVSPGAAAQDGDFIYFLSDSGFIEMVRGAQPRWIGAEKVDRTVLGEVDKANYRRISTAVDPESRRVIFAYPSSSSVDGRPNKISVYDRKLDRWSVVNEDVEIIWSAAGIGVTLEGLDALYPSIEDVPFSLDSRAWVGGAPKLAAFSADFRSGYFDGSPMTAVIETKEVEINEGHRTHLNGFYPLVDGGDVNANVLSRNLQADDANVGGSIQRNGRGQFSSRVAARYHRFRIAISGAWTHAVGVQIDRMDAPAGEGRV